LVQGAIWVGWFLFVVWYKQKEEQRSGSTVGPKRVPAGKEDFFDKVGFFEEGKERVIWQQGVSVT